MTVAHPEDDRVGIVRQGQTPCPDPLKQSRKGYPIVPGVAHELGNLVSVVASWVQRWEQTGAPTPDGGLASRGVNAGLGRLRYSLNRLAGPVSHPKSHLTLVDVNAVLRHSLSTLGPNQVHGHKLTGLAEPDPWPVVGDFWALDLVLVNLVMEALSVSSPGAPIFVKSNNFEAESPIHGVGACLAEGAYVSLSVHHYEDEASKEPVRRLTPEDMPLCLRILEEHGGMLQSTVSPHGESQTAMLLPALARCLPSERKDDSARARCT